MRNRPLCSVCLMVFLIFSIGMTAGGSRFFREPMPPEIKKQAGKEVQITGQVYQIEVRESYQILYLILSKKTARILVYDDAKQSVQIGNKVNVKGELSLFEEARNPGNFDQKFYYEKQKIGAFLWAEALRVTDRESNPLKQGLYELRQKWKRILIDAAGEEDGGALAAILLGEKQGMDREIRELYQVNGIAHVLAISGLHLSFLGVGVYHLLRRITGSYTVGGLAGVLFLSAYILMIGMTVSAFRAMVMFLFRIGADLSGRHYDSPTALAAAAVTVCMWRPLSLYDSGFWLSFGALIAIIFILPIFKNLPAQSLWASVSVNLFLLPILMYSFYEVPIYGVFLNLIVIPLLSVLMAAGLIGTMISLFWEHAGEAIFLCCRIIFRVYEHSCEAALRLPFARVVTGQQDIWKILFYYVFLFAAVLLLRKKEENKGEKRSRKKRVVLSVLLVGTGMTILLFTAQVKDKITITMLDVGQGDGLVIRGPEGKTYFMDGGSSDVKKVGEYRIEPYLLSQGIGSLDYVFASHGDQDHISGIRELVQRQKTGVTIKRLVLPTQTVWDDALKELAEMAEKEGIPVFTMEKGQCLTEGKLSLTCIQPGKGEMEETGNSASLVLALRYGDFDMLFTGDVEGEGEKRLVDHLQGEYSECVWDVLKTAHHGSGNSTTEEFLKTAAPQYAFISAGKNNSYGHPHKETLERLKDAGAIVYSTQEEGAVTIVVSEREFTISGFK
ncbi:MAG: DNA internalization-related competence protein ComEC/Rec2 [Dorea sp.]|nr:DNA internalization-related competence protein ComEC/Rec2 [Dorea sp.]